MYRNCIFCTTDLGANDAIEDFPVGRTLAFDPSKGRLWAICPRCQRWNLAPILERWEAVESAEKRFRGTTLRVHAQNVGLARLPGGTRLVRVGEALPNEIAAWRYGGELRRRRRSFLVKTAAAVALSVAAGIPVFPTQASRKDVIYQSSGPEGIVLRRKELDPVTFRFDPQGETWTMRASRSWRWLRRKASVELEGVPAETVLDRMLLSVNSAGASDRRLEEALALLDLHGSSVSGRAERTLVLRERVKSGMWRGQWISADRSGRARAPEMLALEMARHERTERRAIEGELESLRSRWREAEEIAAIADSL
jgi:hypothetical protein